MADPSQGGTHKCPKAGRNTSLEGCPQAVKHKVSVRTHDSLTARACPKMLMHASTSKDLCRHNTASADTELAGACNWALMQD
eukprot:553517-Alexandrium_andersonii.AAC.1